MNGEVNQYFIIISLLFIFSLSKHKGQKSYNDVLLICLNVLILSDIKCHIPGISIYCFNIILMLAKYTQKWLRSLQFLILAPTWTAPFESSNSGWKVKHDCSQNTRTLLMRCPVVSSQCHCLKLHFSAKFDLHLLSVPRCCDVCPSYSLSCS